MDAAIETTNRTPSADEALSSTAHSQPATEQFQDETLENGDGGPDPLAANVNPEEDPRNKAVEDEDPLEKQRKRERKEFIAVVSFSFLILVIVVVTVSVIVVQNQNRTKAASQPQPTPAPTPAPSSMLIPSPQDKLDYLSWDVNHNNFTAGYIAVLSNKAADLQGKYKDPTEHPVTRAMSWLLDADTNDQQGNLLRRLGLAAVYYSNGGNEWRNTTNWLTSASHCDWNGVQCCGDGDLKTSLVSCAESDRNTIVELDLSNNNLTGSITNVFSFLHDIRVLDLSYNDLVGTIPGPMLGALPNLLELDLQYNQMTGSIPTSLNDNGSLNTVWIQRNNFNGSWPTAFCTPTFQNFAFDCREVICPYQDCCRPEDVCYYDP